MSLLLTQTETIIADDDEPGVTVRFYFDDADPVAKCQCGWHTHGDAAVDASRSWWAHLAKEHEGEMW